jgi:hypothetical protein
LALGIKYIYDKICWAVDVQKVRPTGVAVVVVVAVTLRLSVLVKFSGMFRFRFSSVGSDEAFEN